MGWTTSSTSAEAKSRDAARRPFGFKGERPLLAQSGHSSFDYRCNRSALIVNWDRESISNTKFRSLMSMRYGQISKAQQVEGSGSIAHGIAKRREVLSAQ
jgi:hypothetical protein